MTEIKMPSLGADMEDGTLVEWRVVVGQHVARGDVVGLVETQKATMEIESFVEGVVEALVVEPGTKVAVGAVLARLRASDEASVAAPSVTSAPPAPSATIGAPPTAAGMVAPVAAAAAPPTATSMPPPTAASMVPPFAAAAAPPTAAGMVPLFAAAAAPPTASVAPPFATAAAPAPAASMAPPASIEPERIRSSPAARQRARELGIDLHALRGTGPHGAIVLRDVLVPAAAPSAMSAAPTASPAVAPSAMSAAPTLVTAAPATSMPAATPVAVPPIPAPVAARTPVAAEAPARKGKPATTSPMRDAIAAAMSRSKREIPHYYLAHTISLKRALAWLAETNGQRPIQDRILPGALLLRATALALWEVPELNGFYVDGAYQPSEEVHLATAISLRTGGLIAPAILDADDKSLDQLNSELHDLVARTRAGRLRSSELTSATITVTSLGDRGCEAVWPVINPPQVAIVGFGAIVQRPWVEASAVVPHPTVAATLAADHRVSDGHRGGLFLAALDHHLQEPEKL